MKLLAFILFGLVAGIQAGYLQDGMEYTYRTGIHSAAGTMDVATHTSGEAYRFITRVQKSGNTLNIHMKDVEKSMFVGGHLPTENPYSDAKVKWTKVEQTIKFKIDTENGKVKSITIPSQMSVEFKNLCKGMANMFQLNGKPYAMGESAYKSTETTLHGECDVTYTVADEDRQGGQTIKNGQIIKSVVHMKDCKNRRFRFLDDWRGFRCDMDPKNPTIKESTDGLYSQSTSVYKVKNGNIVKMNTHGSFVSNMFESEGMSHFATVNVTAVLVGQPQSGSDISVSGDTFNNLEFEWHDKDYAWNKNRDLKAQEPFLSSAMNFYKESQSELKQLMLKGLDVIIDSLKKQDKNDANVQKAHKHGIESLYFVIYNMDYSTLKSLAEQLLGDKSERGVQKSNMFNEYLGVAGTSAAAMVVIDMVKNNKFDNDRDAARVLTSIPFHIRRPNKQLVEEFENNLLNWGGAPRFVKMAIPLTFGHLVRVTCMRAGGVECWKDFASKYNQKFWDKYQGTSDRDEKTVFLNAMSNIRFGGQERLLKDMVYGKNNWKNEPSEFRTSAIWTVGWSAMISGSGVNYFMPVFANQKEDHEVRIAALTMLFYSRPSSTDMARVLAVLKTETDYEVINFAYTLFEQFAHTINPCHHEVKENAEFFLKFMKQYSRYETDWGFGVSKTWVREYQKKKYGYGGGYHYYTAGSHKSTTPLTVFMGASTTLMHNYQSQNMGIMIRMEGLAKGLIRKFKTMDPSIWKVADLQKIFFNDMNIKERPDQPIRVSIQWMLKGAVVMSRTYDENSAKEGGKLSEFMKGMMDMGDEYKLNHHRMVQFGGVLYEQPSEIGQPLVYMDSTSWSAHLKATVKRGNHRGLLFRNVKYDINILAQAHSGIMIMNPAVKMSFAIFQSRIYHIHVPREITIGVNPLRKEMKFSVSRPKNNDPLMAFMHAQTMVVAKGNSLVNENTPDLKKSCPSCSNRVVVSRGGQADSRVVFDKEDTTFGFYAKGEYFDCEMDIATKTGTGPRTKALMAFAPYNKNPQTPATIISMGMRQIFAFLALYPRVEKCGIMAVWSQSKTNPTTGGELTLRVQSEENGARMFFRGRKMLVKAIVKVNAEPAANSRSYRASISVETTPGNIENKIKVQIQRAPVSALSIPAYTICANYMSKYPPFKKDMLALDETEKLTVSGKFMVQYGATTECDQGDGEIKLTFKHETTPEGYSDMHDKWYYKKCMEQKNSNEWSGRVSSGGKLPATEACYATMWDGSYARKYHWDIQFVKMTDRMKGIINTFRTLVQAGLVSYMEIDPNSVSGVDTSIGPFMKADVLFKDADRKLDMRMETSQGVQEFKDYPLSLRWTGRLRNLKFTKTIKRLMDMKIISPCVVTRESVRTNDNVTYSMGLDSCWTLASGHCGKTPNFGVFTKKSGSKMATMAYFGGHQVEIDTNGGVKINGNGISLPEGKEHVHSESGVEIFKVFKWGASINVYSFMRVWVSTDTNYVQILPAPSTRGDQCGLCGNFNRNQFDEYMGKDGVTMAPSSGDQVAQWKWKC